MNVRCLIALSLCVSAAHAASVPETMPGLAALTVPEGSAAPSDLAAPPTFGSGIADFNDASSSYEIGLRVFPISGGGYWLLGRHAENTSIVSPFPILTIAKFLPDGSFDSTYGTNGHKTIATPLTFVVDVAEGPGDSLYVFGTYVASGFTDTDFGVYCIDHAGVPCAGFGNNGFASVPLDVGSGADRHNDSPSRIIYAYSSLYLAGSTDTGSGTAANYAMAVVKMSATSGTVDAGFGDDAAHPGVFHHNIDYVANGFESLGDLIAYSPAPFAVRLVLAGTTQRAQQGGEDTDGYIGAIDGITGLTDPLFDTSGFSALAVDIGNEHKDRLERVIRRANGSFLVAGTARDDSASPAQIQLVLAAFRPDGSLDTSFATGGLFHNLVLSGTNRPFGLAERAQNRDIVVGINILDDLFGDGHALQAAVQYDSSAHIQHAFAVQDFEGTPPASYGMDMVLDDDVIATAGYRQWSSSSPRDVDTTIVRYIATDSIFADRFGGTLSD
jgi:hypothetical protein